MGTRPTGTVTFLFTDIEGSTRLWEEHPSDMRVALERHDRILRSVIEDQGGYIEWIYELPEKGEQFDFHLVNGLCVVAH